jgi:DivIVA protein
MPDQSSAATEHAILAEITQPLEALPDDPLAYVNAEFPTALRGYERVAVDEYVRQTRRLVAELQATRSPEAAVRRALERVGEQISGILQRAHETAEQITAQSRVEAEDRLEQARVEAAQIAGSAEQRVRDLDADTDRIWLERQRIVADAEDLAGQLLALAKTAAERFPADPEAAAVGPGTLPYDDQSEAATEAAGAVPADEDPAYFEDEGEDAGVAGQLDAGSDDEVEPDASEIEKTVAFAPLEDRPDEAEAEEADEEADAEASADIERPAASTEDDSTAVIPPASQAASRRRDDR